MDLELNGIMKKINNIYKETKFHFLDVLFKIFLRKDRPF